MTTMKSEQAIKVANEIIDELIRSTIADDAKLKEMDKSIDPNSISYSTHLAKTLKEFINES
jgi:hypothetical protein